MKKSDMIDAIEDAFLEAAPADFPDEDTALQVAASALKYLMSICEDDEESS